MYATDRQTDRQIEVSQTSDLWGGDITIVFFRLRNKKNKTITIMTDAFYI